MQTSIASHETFSSAKSVRNQAVPGAESFGAREKLGTLTRLWRLADRSAHLLHYHRPGQLLRRLYSQMTLPFARLLPAQPVIRAPRIRRLSLATPPLHIPPGFQQDDLLAGRLTLLNWTAEVGVPIDWELRRWPQAPRLWRFHLHYHEFLSWAIQSAPSPTAWKTVWNGIESWIDTFPSSTRFDAAWHPYCISRRVPVWLWLLSQAPAPPKLHGRILNSLSTQVTYLSRHLEQDLGGNHLWENARALVLAGAFFRGRRSQRWLNLGLRWLDECLGDQVADSGEHFERSPGYQAELQEGLVHVATEIADLRPDKSKQYLATARRMANFLDEICHPDGDLPLFSDTTLTATKHDVVRANSSKWIGDYFVHRRQDHQLIFDAGDMAADHLPAHGHCDLLGFEMSLYGKRALVDSGVYAYEGEKRNHFRRSRAHNVLLIDDWELADVWSSFRMGRRGHVVSRSSGRVAEGTWIRAAHDAYRGLGISTCERIWFLADEGPWFAIHRIHGAEGRRYRLTELVHWHPETLLSLQGTNVTVANAGGTINWEPLTPGCTIELERGSYSPDFYVEQSTDVLVLSQRTITPALSGWCLGFDCERAKPAATLTQDGLSLTWQRGGESRSALIPL